MISIGNATVCYSKRLLYTYFSRIVSYLKSEYYQR